MGLGGDSEHTDRQTDRGATGINNMDFYLKFYFNLLHIDFFRIFNPCGVISENVNMAEF